MIGTRVAGPDFAAATKGMEGEVAGFMTQAMEATVDDVKEAFRAQVRAAGLGERLANAVRGVTYPNRGGRKSLNPAGWVYAQPSKQTGRGAAAIIESYASGANIVPRAGRRWLAVPTDDCPRTRQGSALTPEQVEAKFGRRLQFISPADKGFKTPSVRKRGSAFLVMKGLVARKVDSRYRNATERERAGTTRNPRQLQAVIMFTLVRAVKKPQRIDLAAPAAIAGARFEANLNAAWR